MRKNYISRYLLGGLIMLFTCLSLSVSAQILPKVKSKTNSKDPVIVQTYPRRRTVNRYPSTRRLPPGQAKKIYGEKSARDFAPGHQKNKSYGYNSTYQKKHYKKYKSGSKLSGNYRKHDKD